MAPPSESVEGLFFWLYRLRLNHLPGERWRRLDRKNAVSLAMTLGRNGAIIASLIKTCLCRARHNAVYADRRTMPINLLFANVSGTIAVA
jgi:hypothetical protein